MLTVVVLSVKPFNDKVLFLQAEKKIEMVPPKMDDAQPNNFRFPRRVTTGNTT
jgi:hypothetical protein